MLKKYLLLATGLLAFIILIPTFNFHEILSQGDHGRDLYAAQAILRGELPFKDFWWVYGPLMPYVYAPFYFLFGQDISSILLAKAFLRIGCCLFVFLAVSRLASPIVALLASLWFLLVMPDFFFTFNHLGGIMMITAFLWCMISYIQEQRQQWIWRALIFIAVLGLIKINFALTSLLALVLLYIMLTVMPHRNINSLLSKNTRITLSIACLGLPLCWFSIYAFFLQGLTIAEIRQCLPYFGDDQPHHFPLTQTIPYYFTQHYLTIINHFKYMSSAWGSILSQPQSLSSPIAWLILTSSSLNFILHPLWHGITLFCFYTFAFKQHPLRKQFWCIIAFLLGYFILNMHEYIVSIVWYRTFWSQPALLLFHATTISFFLIIAPRFFKILLLIIFSLLIGINVFVQWGTINNLKQPQQFINAPVGQIYVANEPAWVDTVNTTTQFLLNTLNKDERFFALPYDDIYYYLTERPSPTRQLIFFDHIKIKPDQEQRIIAELEKHQTQYVLVSNRIKSPEIGLGEWGKTYCPLLFNYVMNNFEPIFRYGGNWQADPGWANNHGVIIFKRKSLIPNPISAITQ